MDKGRRERERDKGFIVKSKGNRKQKTNGSVYEVRKKEEDRKKKEIERDMKANQE